MVITNQPMETALASDEVPPLLFSHRAVVLHLELQLFCEELQAAVYSLAVNLSVRHPAMPQQAATNMTSQIEILATTTTTTSCHTVQFVSHYNICHLYFI